MKSWLFVGNEDGQESAIPAAPGAEIRTDLSDVTVEGQQSTAQPLEAPAAPEATDPAPVEQITGGAAVEETRVAVEDGEADTAVESQLVEVQGVDNELDALLADGETLEQDTRMVEAVADEVAGSAAEGGLTETAARVAEVAVESYCRRWNISRIKVASESFAARGDRMKATKIAMEGLGETIAKGWDAFVKFVKALVERFTKAFKHYTGLGLSVKEKALKLKAKADGAFGEKKDEKIKGGFLAQLEINGKVDPAAVCSVISKLANESDTVARQLTTYVGAIVENKTAKLPTIKIGVQAKAPGALPNVSSASAMPGAGFFVVTGGELKFTRHASAKVEDLPTPTVDQIRTAAAAAVAAGEALEKGVISDLETLNEAISKIADSKSFHGDALRTAIKSGKNEEVSNVRDAVARSQTAVRSAAAFQDGVVKSLRAAAVGLLGYTQAGIAAYTGGAKKGGAVAAA
jgi:hypothetical protein